jgi:hypothetical protein
MHGYELKRRDLNVMVASQHHLKFKNTCENMNETFSLLSSGRA